MINIGVKNLSYPLLCTEKDKTYRFKVPSSKILCLYASYSSELKSNLHSGPELLPPPCHVCFSSCYPFSNALHHVPTMWLKISVSSMLALTPTSSIYDMCVSET